MKFERAVPTDGTRTRTGENILGAKAQLLVEGKSVVTRHRFQPLVLALLIVGSSGARADVIEIAGNGGIQVLSADARPAVFVSTPNLAGVTRYSGALNEVASMAGVSPVLLEALVWEESRWNPKAVSPKGAIGLSQLMPGTAEELGVDPHDPLANLAGGARYLKMQLDRFGDLELALAAYCAGPKKVVAARGVPAIPEVRTYIDSIIGRIAITNSTP